MLGIKSVCCPKYNTTCAWVYPDGTMQGTIYTKHRRTAAKIVENNNVWKEEFALSHKNKGYDEAEFLILVKGFVSINSGYFNFSNVTYLQKRSLGCDPSSLLFEYDCKFSD